LPKRRESITQSGIDAMLAPTYAAGSTATSSGRPSQYSVTYGAITPTAPVPSASTRYTRRSRRAGRLRQTSRRPRARLASLCAAAPRGARTKAIGTIRIATATRIAGSATPLAAARPSAAFIATCIPPKAAIIPIVMPMCRAPKRRVRSCESGESSAPSAACGTA
jgi:hypothetical protein